MDIELFNLLATFRRTGGNVSGIMRCASSTHYTVLHANEKNKRKQGKCYICFDDELCGFYIPELGEITFKIRDGDDRVLSNGVVTQTLTNMADDVRQEYSIMVQITYGNPTKAFLINYPRCNDCDAFLFESDIFAGSPVYNIENKNKNKAIKQQKEYKNLDEVFCTRADAKECISILMKVTPPVIDKKMYYAVGSRQKGSIIAWVDVLRQKNKLLSIDNLDLIRLLNKKIHSLKLGKSARSFRNKKTTAYIKYKSQYLSLID